MSCLSPVLVRFPPNKDGKCKLVKHPITGKYVYGGFYPCGKCIPCKIAKAREWSMRCMLELPYWEDAIFTTLTYSDDYLPRNGSLQKEDLQKFFKRLRRDLEPLKIRYFACGEYGSQTKRPHYHAIIFGLGLSDRQNYKLNCKFSQNNLIENNWLCGNVFNGFVSSDSCRYCAEYVFKKYNGKKKLKEYDEKGLQVPFQLISRGIGERYLLENLNDLFDRGYVSFKGQKLSFPRYFSDKMQKIDPERYKETIKRRLERSLEDYETVENMEFSTSKKSYEKAIHEEYASEFFGRG